MTRKDNAGLPVARTEGLIVEQVGAETVVFDEDTGQAHNLGSLAAAVFAGSDGRTSVTQLAEIATTRLGESVDVEQVQDVLVQLDELGLMASAPNVISRRAMLRKTAAGAAVGAAFATPLVTSILTPAYAQVSPGADCPRARCVSQGSGDDFCNCVNVCPGCPDPNNSDCKCPGDNGLLVDSCECLNCQQLADAGFTGVCPTPIPCTPGQAGCNSPGQMLDGLCFKTAGDSSEPCPTPG